MRFVKRAVLPGFSLTMGITMSWVGFLILFPMASLLLNAASITPVELWQLITRPAAIASFQITMKYALLTACINVVVGLIIAWTLTRYTFPGHRILDVIIDLPFALPGAVGGIALASIFGKNGIIGGLFETQLVYNQSGILLGLLFVTLPFSVRAVQPLIRNIREEEAQIAYLLGANPFQIFWRVQFPSLIPGISSGFILSFARAIGEYGTVIFVAGNIPLKSEVISRYIYNKIDQYDIQGATATAGVLLLISLIFLMILNVLQNRTWEKLYES